MRSPTPQVLTDRPLDQAAMPRNPSKLGYHAGERIIHTSKLCPESGPAEEAPQTGGRMCPARTAAYSVHDQLFRPAKMASQLLANLDDFQCIFAEHSRY